MINQSNFQCSHKSFFLTEEEHIQNENLTLSIKQLYRGLYVDTKDQFKPIHCIDVHHDFRIELHVMKEIEMLCLGGFC